MPTSTTLPTVGIWWLDPGPLRPLVEEFTGQLANLGLYGPHCAWLWRCGAPLRRMASGVGRCHRRCRWRQLRWFRQVSGRHAADPHAANPDFPGPRV